jgi:hypothetical protein
MGRIHSVSVVNRFRVQSFKSDFLNFRRLTDGFRSISPLCRLSLKRNAHSYRLLRYTSKAANVKDSSHLGFPALMLSAQSRGRDRLLYTLPLTLTPTHILQLDDKSCTGPVDACEALNNAWDPARDTKSAPADRCGTLPTHVDL